MFIYGIEPVIEVRLYLKEIHNRLAKGFEEMFLLKKTTDELPIKSILPQWCHHCKFRYGYIKPRAIHHTLHQVCAAHFADARF